MRFYMKYSASLLAELCTIGFKELQREYLLYPDMNSDCRTYDILSIHYIFWIYISVCQIPMSIIIRVREWLFLWASSIVKP